MKALYICAERLSWNKFISFFGGHLPVVELFCARNGCDAMDIIIHESPISVVIIDNELKEEDQLTIAEDILEAAGQRPIIFIGEVDSTKEVITSELFGEYSTNHLLEKPFQDLILKDAIEKALAWSSTEGTSEAHKRIEEEEEYVPIKLKSFYLYDKVAYDVYFLVYSGNYMKVITKNKRYPESTIQNLARKSIKDLYLKKTEKIKFLEESMRKAIERLSEDNISPSKIMTLQVCSVLLIHEMINEVGVSPTVLQLSELIIDIVPRVFKAYKSFESLFKSLPISYGDIGEQSIFMLYLTYSIARSLSWESDMTLGKLGLASLLHDCKLSFDELSSIRHERDEKLDSFNLADLNSFKEHANLAAQVSTEFTNFQECSFIIKEHHVLPEKKFAHNMNSISCMFAICRRFTTELTHFGFTQNGIIHSLPELKVYDFGNFKVSHDALKKIFLNF